MNFQQTSITGVNNPTQPLTKTSNFGLAVSTTASTYNAPIVLKAISDAALYKTEPVSFYGINNGQTYLLGTSTFTSPTTAPLVVFGIAPGINQIYATWPGENKFAPVTTINNPITVTITAGLEDLDSQFLLSADPISGTYTESSGTVTLTAVFSTSTIVSGDISFYDDSNAIYLGSAPLIENKAVLVTGDLHNGRLVLSASWPGGGQNIGGDLHAYNGAYTFLPYTVRVGPNSVTGTNYIAPPLIAPQIDTWGIDPGTVITLTSDPNPSTAGYEAVTFKASIQSTSTFTGYITFEIYGDQPNFTKRVVTAPLIGSTATWVTGSLSNPEPGDFWDYNITAKYFPSVGSTGSFLQSNVLTQIVYNAATSTITISSNNTSVYQLDTFEVTAQSNSTYTNLINEITLNEKTNRGGLVPISWVDFNHSSLTTFTVDPNDLLPFNVITDIHGIHQLQAHWVGQGSIDHHRPLKPVDSNILQQKIIPAQISLSTTSAIAIKGEPIQVQVTTDQIVGSKSRTIEISDSFNAITGSTYTIMLDPVQPVVAKWEMNILKRWGALPVTRYNNLGYAYSTTSSFATNLSAYGSHAFYRITLDKVYNVIPKYFSANFHQFGGSSLSLSHPPCLYPVISSYNTTASSVYILGNPGAIWPWPDEVIDLSRNGHSGFNVIPTLPSNASTGTFYPWLSEDYIPSAYDNITGNWGSSPWDSIGYWLWDWPVDPFTGQYISGYWSMDYSFQLDYEQILHTPTTYSLLHTVGTGTIRNSSSTNVTLTPYNSTGTYELMATISRTQPFVYSNTTSITVVNSASTNLSVSIPSVWQAYLGDNSDNTVMPQASIVLNGSPWPGYDAHGVITLLDLTNNNILGTANVNGVGSYSITWDPRAHGETVDTHRNIQALYSGSAGVLRSTSTIQVFYPERNITGMVLNSNNSMPTVFSIFTATIAVGNTTVLDSNLNLSLNNFGVTNPSTASFNNTTTISITVQNTSAGWNALSVYYPGDAHHEPITSNIFNIDVKKVSSPITSSFTSDLTHLAYGPETVYYGHSPKATYIMYANERAYITLVTTASHPLSDPDPITGFYSSSIDYASRAFKLYSYASTSTVYPFNLSTSTVTWSSNSLPARITTSTITVNANSDQIGSYLQDSIVVDSSGINNVYSNFFEDYNIRFPITIIPEGVSDITISLTDPYDSYLDGEGVVTPTNWGQYLIHLAGPRAWACKGIIRAIDTSTGHITDIPIDGSYREFKGSTNATACGVARMIGYTYDGRGGIFSLPMATYTFQYLGDKFNNPSNIITATLTK